MNAQFMLTQVTHYLRKLQENISQSLVSLDNAPARIDNWKSSLGTGNSRILSTGTVFEKGGVNFSHVRGSSLPSSASASRPHIAGKPYQAVGVSLVLHPHNPYVPTCHMNIRFFCAGDDSPLWWFGGGYDLTPYYGFDEDCIHWHKTAQAVCDTYESSLYSELSAWCRDYFFIRHRNEPRGIGGIFFDDFQRWDFARCFSFIKSVGDSFLPAYLPIVEKRRNSAYTDAQSQFQQIRRGRYVEFNLVYDRGTLFGLQSGGRSESILMSLPKHVQWHYDWQPEKNSPEEKLTTYFLKKTNWI